MISAAAVTTRPVRASPSATLSSLSARLRPEPEPVLADTRQQEHLVVHRGPKATQNIRTGCWPPWFRGRRRPQGPGGPPEHLQTSAPGMPPTATVRSARWPSAGSTRLPVQRNSRTKVIAPMMLSTNGISRGDGGHDVAVDLRPPADQTSRPAGPGPRATARAEPWRVEYSGVVLRTDTIALPSARRRAPTSVPPGAVDEGSAGSGDQCDVGDQDRSAA